MFDFLKKKTVPVAEKKSYGTQQAMIGFIQGVANEAKTITPKKALFYYDMVAPVATAVDIVNDEFKTLTLAVQKVDGIKTLSHPVLTFLQAPNDDMVLIDFLENVGNFFLVTNEVYIVATGKPNRPPAELLVCSPENVEVKKDANGFIEKIEVRYGTAVKQTFTRSDKEYRFYNAEGTAEIWQIKGFDTRQTGRGRSKLSSAVYEIEQYLQSSIHNLGLLENGVRSTGAFTTDDALTDEQFDRLREQINATQAGAENAGKSIILEGGMDYREMSISPKDMDFASLKKTTMEAIFRRYKIPLALISTEHMAESTMEVSSLMLYDNAVLPMAKRLLAEITHFIGPRFGMGEDEKIVAYMEDITALQIRRIREVKNKKELGVFTTNEIREGLGDKGVGPDGDIIYIPSNLVPLGTEKEDPNASTVGVDNRQTPPDAGMDANIAPVKTTRDNFISILKNQVNVTGSRTYTDDEITKLADEEGL